MQLFTFSIEALFLPLPACSGGLWDWILTRSTLRRSQRALILMPAKGAASCSIFLHYINFVRTQVIIISVPWSCFSAGLAGQAKQCPGTLSL